MKKLEMDLGLFAQAWCTKENEHKEMDVELAKACHEIAQKQLDEWYKENIENAPTYYGVNRNSRCFWAIKTNFDAVKVKLVCIKPIKDKI